MEKTHYKKLRNPNYIGSYELMTGSSPIELVVTIDKAIKEQVQNGDKKEEAMVVYLKSHKPMIVNSTNAKAIASATGSPYVEDWSGKNITLYVAKIRAFGENVDALRVRKEAPVSAPLPGLTTTHKNFIQGIEALEAKKVSLPDLVSVLQSKFTVTDQILKQLENATK